MNHWAVPHSHYCRNTCDLLDSCVNLLHDSVSSTRNIRYCVEPCTVEGIRFEKGNTIFVPVYNLHRDEEIWPEPEKFDPDRSAHSNLLVLSTDAG